MSALLIWMNTQEAKLFQVEAESIHGERVQYHGPLHPSESLGKNHPKNQSDEEKFYHQLLEKVKDSKADKWLLMGPSFGATHFATFLQDTAPHLHRKIIGVEKVDKMPDSEILSVGRKHLQRYYLYHST